MKPLRGRLLRRSFMGVVGGEGYGGAVGEAGYGDGVVAGGKRELVGLEELSGEIRRGGDDARDGAKADGEQGAPPEGEVAEGGAEERCNAELN